MAVSRPRPRRNSASGLIASKIGRAIIAAAMLLMSGRSAPGLDPTLDISQYAHTAWTVRDGFSMGNIYAMAQTPDGYLWFGTEFGLFRFDGVRSTRWQPPAGQTLPDKNINSLLVTRDGTLWIGTFAGLVTWRDGKLDGRAEPELRRQFISSLYEDREGTVWAATLTDHGRLCAIRSTGTECHGEDGAFGRAVWTVHEDNSGALWAGAQSGLWRLKPGPPRRYPAPELIGLSETDDRGLLIAIHGAGLLRLAGDNLESYSIRGAINSDRLLQDHDIDANRLLRDRDGGLWIGTVERGLIHIHHGRTDLFSRADGLSGDVVLSIFEDREGNVWVATTGGLDRFRELPVATLSVKQGLSSDATQAVLAAADGSVWIGAHAGLSRWRNGETSILRKASGLPDDAPQSMFEDDRARVWVSTARGLAYFQNGRFVTVDGVSGGVVHFIAGDKAGNLWLSEQKNLLHLLDGRLAGQVPWSQLGRHQSAEVLLSGREPGSLWLGFWVGGGVSYFRDGQLRKSYAAANGLGEGPVQDLRLDRDGALWAATQTGVSRLKDDRITTLSTRNGLPCDIVHWTIEDDDRSFWLYTACGLVRIARAELDAWIADPKRVIENTVWDTGDGVRLRSSASSEYGPRVAKSIDGKLWFVTGEGVQIVDPRHLAFNPLPPPVEIEGLTADGRNYWQASYGNVPSSKPQLPPRVRDVSIDYTALSLVSPEKVRFRFKLEGQDRDWREVINNRQVQYSNLGPGHYIFRVTAANNSGVWNQAGTSLQFSIAPAYYQTSWFRFSCVAALLFLLWGFHEVRVRQLAREFNASLDARVNERTRIARDLHDTLLQSFHGLLLRFQAVSNELPAGNSKKKLDSAIDQAAQAITEGRDAVQGLRASTVERNDLALAIRTMGEELAVDAVNGNSVEFSVQVEGEPRELHPILRDEVYRIAGEAMRNAFRHAKARHIAVEIHYDQQQLRLNVRDDGIGIGRNALGGEGRAGHFGLHGMRERAKLMGGALAVWSEMDSGTEVELSVPASHAYDRAAAGWGSRLSGFARKLAGKEDTAKS